MSTRIQIPRVNFSRDLRVHSLAFAGITLVLALGAVSASAVLVYESAGYRTAQERMAAQAAELAAEAANLNGRQNLNEPEAGALGALRQRIVSLNALDFGQAPSINRVLAALEQLMPPPVALQNLDYDRAKGTLELVAISGSSDELTSFFDIASRSSFFKTVRLLDKKQAGTAEDGSLLYQVRLSISLASGEPKA
jgi:Tfp pilus assembly protein PilN